MSLKKIEKSQNALSIRVSPINTDSQKTPAECRFEQIFHPFELNTDNTPHF